MFVVKRSSHNPILQPVKEHPWEALAAFNWSPVKRFGRTHVLYRAMSLEEPLADTKISTSIIGHAASFDGIHFNKRTPLITPEHDWEKYGCEDPRVTKLNGKYYIFYTALSTYPFSGEGIKIAVAITKNFKTITEKHLVTPFNAKAMALFPEKVNGKFAALLTVHTDIPPEPSHIAYVEFDQEEEMWSPEYWQQWHNRLDSHTLSILRSDQDHVEVGAPPIKTKEGWLLIYSYMQNYFSDNKTFGIEALLLDPENPRKIIGRTDFPMLVPQELYEKYGHVPNIVFPSGALTRGDNLDIYYGAADTSCCIATVKISNLLASMATNEAEKPVQRFHENPIISPNKAHSWEAKATFNPAAIDLDGRVHLLYRAMSKDDTSVLGYASSKDGLHIDEFLKHPVYKPREDFEIKKQPGNSGCEDPRLVLVGDVIYMTYTAFDAVNMPRVAVTRISAEDFLAKKWNWSAPNLISPQEVMDKNACLFPETINGQYMLLHRVGVDICADFVDSLDFSHSKLTRCIHVMQPRPGMWDSIKVGISAPPLKIKEGWLLLYHGISNDSTYRVGAALLDKENPTLVLARTDSAILQPEMPYEKEGQVNNVVFPCGAVLRKDTIFIYYGGADSYVGVATVSLPDILRMFT